MDSMILSVANFIISYEFIALWCLLILTVAFVSVYKVKASYGKINEEILRTNNAVRDFQDPDLQQIENLGNCFDRNRYLKDIWQQFSVQLIRSKDTRKKSATMVASEQYFNFQNVTNHDIPHRLFAHVPNQLTAFGIVGTFIGLSAGVFLAKDGLNKNEMTQLQVALSQLLGGASLAFITSIVGIGTSLFFTKIHHHYQNASQKVIQKLNLILSEIFSRNTVENLIVEQTFMGDTQHQVMIEMLAELKSIKSQKEILCEKVLKNIVEEFRHALTSGASSQLNSISQEFEKTSMTLKQCAVDMRENTKVIIESGETSLKIIENGLQQAAKSFDLELKNAVTSISSITKEASRDLGSGIIDASIKAANELKVPANELSESVRILCESSRQATEDWTDALLCTEKIADHLVKTQDTLRQMSGLPSIYSKEMNA